MRNYSQEYVAQELGISQSVYARIESGAVIPKIDRLQRIAEILDIDISVLLSTTNVFNIVFNATATANQSGYITNHGNNSVDIELIRKMLQEELGKI